MKKIYIKKDVKDRNNLQDVLTHIIENFIMHKEKIYRDIAEYYGILRLFFFTVEKNENNEYVMDDEDAQKILDEILKKY